VWNLFKEIGTAPQRQEILDWYHLRENLYKVGGSLKRLKQAEAMLWQGQVDEAIALFADCRRQQAKNFCAYLDKHRRRIVNYEYFQAEQLSSIGSGAVESAVKQIDRRLKISGALRESRKYPSSVATALCLPQWFTRCLIFLQKWDAPVSCRVPIIIHQLVGPTTNARQGIVAFVTPGVRTISFILIVF